MFIFIIEGDVGIHPTTGLKAKKNISHVTDGAIAFKTPISHYKFELILSGNYSNHRN